MHRAAITRTDQKHIHFLSLTTEKQRSKRAPNLQLEGIRGIACLLVALNHVFYINHLDPSVVVPPWLRTMEAGGTGVLIFFVLSGYLISWTNAGDCTPDTCRSYLWRRFIRLAPIYYVACSLTLVVQFILRLDLEQNRSLLAAYLGLQNYNDYFALHLPPPIANGPLWSLNYELLYYGLFILLWRYQPRQGWIFIPAIAAALLGWFAPHYMPLFLASYACGWVFWAAGWWLARRPELPATAPRPPIISWLLLTFASHQIEGLRRILNALGLHSADSGMVPFSQLSLLPPILLLLAAVSMRQLPARFSFEIVAWFLCLIPIIGMLWTGRMWTEPAWINGGIAVVFAAAVRPIRSTRWLKLFAWLGSISYAFYVVHFPLLFVVQSLPLPGGDLPAYFLRIGIWAGLVLALAWVLERQLQPWIKARLTRASPI